MGGWAIGGIWVLAMGVIWRLATNSTSFAITQVTSLLRGAARIRPPIMQWNENQACVCFLVYALLSSWGPQVYRPLLQQLNLFTLPVVSASALTTIGIGCAVLLCVVGAGYVFARWYNKKLVQTASAQSALEQQQVSTDGSIPQQVSTNDSIPPARATPYARIEAKTTPSYTVKNT
ncbi:MAG: hypothetical protein A3J38_08180 [Gammaproteobacteria bacterium RIFCSPHIGHO2_12_FULL_45_9]|nr:MAG: hypothetical protein A3J38_08180 [Gammaproteobacteria bacterium RIFCSPHIGHO2_12_FULL_45_9]